MAKIKRNDPCPCGSGKKYKRCCLGKGVSADGFSREERGAALEKLESFVEKYLVEEDEEAFDIFYERWDDSLEDVDPMWMEQSDAAYDMWLFVDYRLQKGETVVDRFLGRNPPLTPGERLYLELLRNTTMRLYEIMDLSPGESVTLRDVLDNTRVTVNERSGSRSMQKYTLVAARIMTRGASGGPEIEMGIFQIPDLIREKVISQLTSHREAYRKKHPRATGAEFFKEMTLFFHDAWLSCILEPPIPRMTNTDGEEMVETYVRFDVLDSAGLEAALDGAVAIKRMVEAEPGWIWTGKNKKGKPVILGELLLEGEVLTFGCNSTQRAERGRRMIEAIAAGAIRYRTTVHENLEKKLRKAIRTGQAYREDEMPPEEALPRQVQEALVLDELGRYYRNWLDEKIPMLDDHTPREAAADPARHPKLFELIHGLERTYQLALKEAQPAYDPSWMWRELGFEDHIRVAYPPRLAHERMASIVPGLGELIRGVAANLRNQPGFDDASTVVGIEDIQTNLEIQRFLRNRNAGNAGSEDPPPPDAESLAAHMAYMINFDLHRRTTFWVDDSLAYLLAKTNLEIPGSDLRAPFASFALVFTDRFVLSLGERLLSVEPACPLAGHFLRIVTVYVNVADQDPDRTLHICFAFDAIGADPPHLVMHEIALQDDSLIRPLPEDPLPIKVEGGDAVPDADPFRQLLHVTLSAILYATSASVSPQQRSNPSAERSGEADSEPDKPLFSNETVFFLPGAIEISHLREFQELERISSGRKFLHRFMVRGHWRRAAPGWRDQRVRWIAPHWKGPDIGTIIERTYKLKP
jgi:SEC-C motif